MSHDELWAPLVVVRVDPERIDLPRGRDPKRWAPERNRRLLEDLHARRLRDRALSRAAERGDKRATRARVPLPLLDVRSGEGAQVLFGPAGGRCRSCRS